MNSRILCGLKNVLKCVTRATLLSKPAKVNEFQSQYFSQLAEFIKTQPEDDTKDMAIEFQERWEREFFRQMLSMTGTTAAASVPFKEEIEEELNIALNSDSSTETKERMPTVRIPVQTNSKTTDKVINLEERKTIQVNKNKRKKVSWWDQDRITPVRKQSLQGAQGTRTKIPASAAKDTFTKSAERSSLRPIDNGLKPKPPCVPEETMRTRRAQATSQKLVCRAIYQQSVALNKRGPEKNRTKPVTLPNDTKRQGIQCLKTEKGNPDEEEKIKLESHKSKSVSAKKGECARTMKAGQKPTTPCQPKPKTMRKTEQRTSKTDKTTGNRALWLDRERAGPILRRTIDRNTYPSQPFIHLEDPRITGYHWIRISLICLIHNLK